MVYALKVYLNPLMECLAVPLVLANRGGHLLITVDAYGLFTFTGHRGIKRAQRSYPNNKREGPIVATLQLSVNDLLQAIDEVVLYGTLFRVELEGRDLRFIVRNDSTGMVKVRQVSGLDRNTFLPPDAAKHRRVAAQADIVATGPAWCDWIVQAEDITPGVVPEAVFEEAIR